MPESLTFAVWWKSRPWYQEKVQLPTTLAREIWNAALEAAVQVLDRYLYDGTTAEEDDRIRHSQQALRNLKAPDARA